MSKNNKAIAIYCRVSTDKQSNERQKNDLSAHAAKLGYEVLSVHQEVLSGTARVRPERDEVMRLAQARRIDAILVTELSRWSRSIADIMLTVDQLTAWGVSLLTVEGLEFNLNTAVGRIEASVAAAAAQIEREKISERVKSGLQAAKAKGKKLGRQHGDNFKQAKHKDQVLKLREEGKSYRAIAEVIGIDKDTVMAVLQHVGG